MDIQINRKTIILILFFGSLWGFSEVVLGGILYKNSSIHHPDIFLSIIAFCILAVAYTSIRRNGITTSVASVAALFRAVNAGPFYCHLLAIFLLGVVFDLITLSIKTDRLNWLTGAFSAWLGYALFAFTITYVFRYHYWTVEGFQKVIRYIGKNGTFTALGSTLPVFLGYRIGKNIENILETRPKVAYGGVIGLTLCFWILAGL